MNLLLECTHRDISKVIDPTVSAFAPLLKSNKSFIKSIPFKSIPYRSGQRPNLDIYYPPYLVSNNPILFFIYGGGFNSGDRSISPNSFGLVYANIAAYFTRKNYIVIIPDYRLVPDITFPTPAKDIRDAILFIIQNPIHLHSTTTPSPDLHSIHILAHSAGAAHVASMLFLPDILPKDHILRIRIKAVILQAPPYDLSAMTPEWPNAPVHAAYWSSLDIAKQNDPLHLYQRLDHDILITLPRILMVQAEFEPDWLIDAGILFRNSVKQRSGHLLDLIIAKGHNHISLNWALSSGQGEEWAVHVLQWLNMP